jgi:hypothetical protein
MHGGMNAECTVAMVSTQNAWLEWQAAECMVGIVINQKSEMRSIGHTYTAFKPAGV